MDTTPFDNVITTLTAHGVPSSAYFFAGGFVTTPNTATDVDVYCYSDHDLSLVLTALGTPLWTNPNTANYSINHRKIQVITSRVGTPMDIISAFDWNKSQIAYTTTGQVIKHPDYDRPLHLHPENMSDSSITRYGKYALKKGFDMNLEYFPQLISILYPYRNSHLSPSYENGYTEPTIYRLKSLINIIFYFSANLITNDHGADKILFLFNYITNTTYNSTKDILFTCELTYDTNFDISADCNHLPIHVQAAYATNRKQSLTVQKNPTILDLPLVQQTYPELFI